ncbi:hypothetical protein [Azospirillum sp. sgz301742]
MSDSYVEGKVREALQAAKGSPSVAQQLLITWAVKDPELLLGMAQPFLKAIAGAAVARAGRRSAAPARGAGPSGALSREALERVLSRMGEVDDGGVAPQAARPAAAPVRQAPEGVSHEKSMLTLAKAFAAKKVR